MKNVQTSWNSLENSYIETPGLGSKMSNYTCNSKTNFKKMYSNCVISLFSSKNAVSYLVSRPLLKKSKVKMQHYI